MSRINGIRNIVLPIHYLITLHETFNDLMLYKDVVNCQISVSSRMFVVQHLKILIHFYICICVCISLLVKCC